MLRQDLELHLRHNFILSLGHVGMLHDWVRVQSPAPLYTQIQRWRSPPWVTPGLGMSTHPSYGLLTHVQTSDGIWRILRFRRWSVVLTHGAAFWLQIPGLAEWMWAQETGGEWDEWSVGLAVRSLLGMWPAACVAPTGPVKQSRCEELRLRRVPVFVLPLVSSCSVTRPRGLHLVSPPTLLTGATTGSISSGYKIILTVQIMGAPSTGWWLMSLNALLEICVQVKSLKPENWPSQFGNLCLCNTYC